jgi:hypothetical protein
MHQKRFLLCVLCVLCGSKKSFNHKGHKVHEGKKRLDILDQFLPTLTEVGVKKDLF